MVIAQPVIGQSEIRKLTKREVNAWLSAITYDQLLEHIIEWDYIERVTPIIVMPDMMYLLEDRDLYVYPLEDQMVSIKIGKLEYGAKIEKRVIEGFAPSVKVGYIVMIGVASFGVGMLTALILSIVF